MSIVGSGSLVMERSTVSNNRASEEAGGIRLLGDPDADNRIFNSTISGNRAGEDGGGIWLTGRNLLVVNSTFSENTSSRGGSAIHVCGQCNPNNLHLVNTIIGGTCSYNSFFGFPFGEGNIESPGDTCAFGSDNLTSVSFSELGLGPLRDNGGGTRTHLPGAGSVAIDRTPLPSCMVGFDQRGFSRPQGAGCDVGAVEVVP